jgi:hypothetical protein
MVKVGEKALKVTNLLHTTNLFLKKEEKKMESQ